MDRVVYFFEDGSKRVERVTEKEWLEEIQSEIACMKNIASVDAAVAEFNSTLQKLQAGHRVAYLRCIK
mgnify:CR=1 FL=1